MEQQADLAAFTESRRQLVEDGRAPLLAQRVVVERQQRDAPLADGVELGLDARHRPATVPVHEAQVDAVPGFGAGFGAAGLMVLRM